MLHGDVSRLNDGLHRKGSHRIPTGGTFELDWKDVMTLKKRNVASFQRPKYLRLSAVSLINLLSPTPPSFFMFLLASQHYPPTPQPTHWPVGWKRYGTCGTDLQPRVATGGI